MVMCSSCFLIFFVSCGRQRLSNSVHGFAALLLELEKRINEVIIESSESGFTRPGSYIFEFLASMKINWETATMLIDTIDQATNLLEDGNHT